MDCALYLSAVKGVSVSGNKVGIAVNRDDIAIRILFDRSAFHDITAHEAHFTVRLHTKEFGRRYFGKIIGIDIKLLAEWYLTCAGFGVVLVVRKIKVFNLVIGVVINYQLHGMKNGDASRSFVVELFTYAMLKQSDIDHAVRFGDTDTVAEIKDGRGGISTAAESAERGHTRVVPAVNDAVFDEISEITLGKDGVGYVETGKLDLTRL